MDKTRSVLILVSNAGIDALKSVIRVSCIGSEIVLMNIERLQNLEVHSRGRRV
jgi:hypothetical protein